MQGILLAAAEAPMLQRRTKDPKDLIALVGILGAGSYEEAGEVKQSVELLSIVLVVLIGRYSLQGL